MKCAAKSGLHLFVVARKERESAVEFLELEISGLLCGKLHAIAKIVSAADGIRAACHYAVAVANSGKFLVRISGEKLESYRGNRAVRQCCHYQLFGDSFGKIQLAHLVLPHVRILIPVDVMRVQGRRYRNLLGDGKSLKRLRGLLSYDTRPFYAQS